MSNSRILLIIGGGIAAYKTLDLIRQLQRSGSCVTPILTQAAQEFVTPLSVSAIANQPVRQNLFDLGEESQMDHIQLSRQSDLVVVAPATADLLAKMANGRADDLASTVLLATDKPVLVAPAMNVRMWLHPATQRNSEILRQDGVHFVGPNEGEMACGETGPGRMSEPDQICRSIGALCSDAPLKGRRVLVTSGPTWEKIDPVRVLANRSSGRQGTEIAKALISLGAEVVFVTGPTFVGPPPNAEVIRVESADEMLRATEASFPVDAVICAAAVTDWRVASNSNRKLKKISGQLPTIKLVENPDILAMIGNKKRGRPELVIGFAAETENLVSNAAVKRQRKGCDWIIANDVSVDSGVLGGNENQVVIITSNGEEHWPRMTKAELARRLAKKIATEWLGT